MNEQHPPKYKRLKLEILSWIADELFKPHEKLPSENEIAKRFDMSRQTVRQTLGELEREGWLYRRQGKGTFIAGAPEQVRPDVSEGMKIGMITTYISDYIFPTIVRGVESALRARGARLLLASTDNEKNKERDSLESMLREPLSGLIIEPTRSAEGNPNFPYFLALESQNIPYVMINERYADVDAPCLRVDDEAGGCLATEHLIGLGHERIVGLFKIDDYQGVHRMRGFRRAHREHGLPLAPEHLIRYTTEEKEGLPAEALAALLAAEPGQRPTAIVCYNDQLAVRLLDVIRGQGLTVPMDLSIVGFDDSTLATATEVKLTSIAHPKTKMGEDAVQLLMGLIEERGARLPGEDRVYAPQLIIRQSTRRRG
ncbi:GntR family transcriptional regulator [Paenibacillus sp. 1P07SE]|uniref:GntR family transcriptional regulator n=1 Tax=Paenibacillus sp. 1P07SE TaxID=3132209 RepID=UPI0039A77992